MYLKQVQAAQRSNVGTTYINGYFNRGAMKKVFAVITAAMFVSFSVSIILKMMELRPNDFIAFLGCTVSAIFLFGACYVLYEAFITQDDPYDPYDISDMD